MHIQAALDATLDCILHCGTNPQSRTSFLLCNQFPNARFQTKNKQTKKAYPNRVLNPYCEGTALTFDMEAFLFDNLKKLLCKNTEPHHFLQRHYLCGVTKIAWVCLSGEWQSSSFTCEQTQYFVACQPLPDIWTQPVKRVSLVVQLSWIYNKCVCDAAAAASVLCTSQQDPQFQNHVQPL